MTLKDYAIWKLGTTYQLEMWTNKGLHIYITETEQEAKSIIKLKTGVTI
jgi:hypothetical protein